jgi:glucose/mannose-6-phosphate isomerase
MVDPAILDSTVRYDDPALGTMRDLLAGFPAQARQAWRIGKTFNLPDQMRDLSDVLMLGMGGSGIGGDVIATIAMHTRSVPIRIIRNYGVPATGEDSLVVGSSFSGNTEETLEAFEHALEAPGHQLAITTGGRLAELAGERNVPVLRYEWSGPPRTALGYGVFAPLALLTRLGAIDLPEGEVEATFSALDRVAERCAVEIPTAANVAKRLAWCLFETVPVIVGPDFLDVAARRWATDINENAKQWAFALSLPELNHNQIEGMAAPSRTLDHLSVVLLSAPSLHPRNRLRVELTGEVLRRVGVSHHQVLVGGETPLEAVLEACSLGSWTSFYLAVLNAVEPLPTPTMDALKDRLGTS